MINDNGRVRADSRIICYLAVVATLRENSSVSFKKLSCSCTELLQSYVTLCNPMRYSPLVSSDQGILQARILEWVAMPFSRDLPDPGGQT